MSTRNSDGTETAAARPLRRWTVTDFAGRKAAHGASRITMLTAYTAPMARMLDRHIDILLVGDSLGMVIYGHETTLPVDLETMIRHGAAVVRGSAEAMVIVDMPFGSYQESTAQAFRNCARVLAETGAAAVKIEGGAELAPTIRHLTSNGIPVMAHIGLMPQRVHALGGFKAQGKGDEAARAIVQDARAVVEAGAFSVLLEGVIEPVGRQVTTAVDVPVIGIGASPACDGQVLVTEDILGLFGLFTPRFVKRYAELGAEVEKAVATYAAEVRAGTFPGPGHCFGSAK